MSHFAHILLNWFRDNGREMPWRDTTDAYAIWLSEIILQQTQVKQGWGYWERFMQRWPTVEALAEATEDEVLRQWQGLGYYSRARNLHAAAQQVVARGGFPDTLEGLRQLKGVGDYTAAAIASFAFGLPAAVVDGNVYRVLARHFGIDTPINTAEGKKVFAMLAQQLLPVVGEASKLCSEGEAAATLGSVAHYGAATLGSVAHYGAATLGSVAHYGAATLGSVAHYGAATLGSVAHYNQAIMDFGATQCTPQAPRCAGCPLQESCVAFREGRVGQLPVKLKKLKVRERRLTYVYIRCGGMTAIHRRGPGDIWQGLWEPPVIEDERLGIEDVAARGDTLRGSVFNVECLKRDFRHVLTHQVLLADLFLLEADSRPGLPPDYIWIAEADIDGYALPRLIERLLQYLPENKSVK